MGWNQTVRFASTDGSYIVLGYIGGDHMLDIYNKTNNTRMQINANQLRFYENTSTQKNTIISSGGTLNLADITATNYHNLPSQ